MSERWKMNRIGFVNFWLYDEETFEFEHGKLLLRGQNGSGKSITTQSFIPFILDGDRTPSRLDPFGSSDRRMEYYFLGEEGKDEATGYLFLEFRKETTGECRTIGIGQRARRGKPMDFWGFVILDGRRIGYDLWLYREAGSSKLPLTRQELKKLLGEATPFTDVPGEYKALVNKYIFGFRKMEQYEQFIKLLVKVRAPKLSKEFKPTKVYEILNESLQTLTDEDLRAMVDAMEKMDSIQESLEELTRAFVDVKTIRNEYTRYNQYMLAKKGEAYLTKKTEVETGQKELNDREANKRQMLQEQQDKTLRKEELDGRMQVLEAELISLYDTDMEEADRKLEQARAEKERIGQQIRKWETKIDEYQNMVSEKGQSLDILKRDQEAEQDTLEQQKAELEEHQEILRWKSHDQVITLIENRRAEGTDMISSRLSEYRKSVLEAQRSLEQYELVSGEYAEREEQFDKCCREKQSAEQAEEEANRRLIERQDEMTAAFFEQFKENTEWTPELSVLKELEDDLKHYQTSAMGDTIAKLLQQDYTGRRLYLLEQQQEAARKMSETKMQLDETRKQLEEIRNKPEIEPERDEQTNASRKAMQQAGICGVPFFKTVEFAGELEPAECARLEAQLEKMGVLDALVVSEQDYQKILCEFPQFMDTVLHTEQKGTSEFRKLLVNETLSEELQEAVCRILSNIYETEVQEQGIYLKKDGIFRHGLLTGKTDKSGEAQYVGTLARETRRQRMIAELEEKEALTGKKLEEDTQKVLQLKRRIEKLEEEYGNIPDFRSLNEILDSIQRYTWELQQISEQYKILEKQMQECQKRKNQKYQSMLQCCRSFPYGRTAEQYQEVLDVLEEYRQIWQNARETLIRLENYLVKISTEEELLEHAQTQMDDAFGEKRRYTVERGKQEIIIRQCEEYLNQPERKQQRERIEILKREKLDVSKELGEIEKDIAVLADRIQRILAEENEKWTRQQERIGQENYLRICFEEELSLKLVLDREERSLAECAKAAQSNLRDSDKNREPGDLFNALFQVYQRHNGSLIPYGTTLENCFANSQEIVTGSMTALRSRVQIVSVWNGKKVYLEEFFQILKQAIEETQLLIQEKDRELFEDILSQTISRQLTDRIAESRKWVKDMSTLMKQMDTSMGLCFSLDWKPKSADNDGEIDTLELEQILLRDQALLTVEDISRVASHFRSKIRTEKTKQEERGGVVNYMDMVREALDYRNWFEFQMYYRRGDEARRPLTNAAFNRFSGGEKAMAMYVPLFAAVNAQYQKAALEDHPRIIALDEAFAGVDDKNISSMFELVHILDFDYIMNSQALWGCYEKVPGLRIAELLRPLNSQIVTVIRYTWNGRERILDEQ